MFAPTDVAPGTIQRACEAFIEADRLIAEGIGIVAHANVESSTGLSTEMLLILAARRTSGDAHVICQAAATLRDMPATHAAFTRGELSWGQVRAITQAVRTVDVRERARIDDLVRSQAPRLATMDPDEVICKVDDLVTEMRADLAQVREQRRIETGFLAIQGRTDGSATLYGEADAESAATLIQALDAQAGSPVAPEEDRPTRPQQYMQALIGICESSLSGSHSQMRPRPRLIATIDLQSLREDAGAASARVLWALAGRTPRLTPLSTETLMCDATTIPVVFDGARPIAVGDAYAPISPKLRTALVARDGGCRFPGCPAPSAWTDAHHIVPRLAGGPTSSDNLILLCRRCHRLAHRYRWKIEWGDDGVVEFTRLHRKFASSPRAPARE